MQSSSQISRKLNGEETEVVIQHYADRVLVLVTQLGKVGSLIQASIPPTTPLLQLPQGDSTTNSFALVEPPPSIELTRLLGSAPSDDQATLQSLYASQIATFVWTQGNEAGSMEEGVDRRSVVVGLALKPPGRDDSSGVISETTRTTFMEVMQMVVELIHDSKASIAPS